MKNYYKTVTALSVLYFIAVIVFALYTGHWLADDPGRNMEIVKLNDISKDAGSCWDNPEELGNKDYGSDFALIDTEDNLLFKSYQADDEDLSLGSAMKKGCLYSCVTVNDMVKGYVILNDNGNDRWRDIRLKIITGSAVIGLLLILSAILFGKYIEKSIIIPFENMKIFAANIAEGKLDSPLYMDRNNMFGAFTESFDIMREELDASRKREITLQRRERELVASLSHDLKTPVTGIKVTTELLKTKLSIESPNLTYMIDRLDNIYKKADQIDVLVSDLFSSTMEDLDELRVSCVDESSEVLNDIIRKYDDRNLVTSQSIPKVLIHIDVKRMSQVIGNIISNSYKYANTGIEVCYKLVDDYLEMDIKDSGPGVPEDELSLITNKFYRGKQWADSREEGSGLGLYIAKLLMEKMDGELLPVNLDEGFMITLMLPLS